MARQWRQVRAKPVVTAEVHTTPSVHGASVVWPETRVPRMMGAEVTQARLFDHALRCGHIATEKVEVDWKGIDLPRRLLKEVRQG